VGTEIGRCGLVDGETGRVELYLERGLAVLVVTVHLRTHARRADYRRKLVLTIYAPRFPGGPRQN